jgi:hypothetical protein
MLPQTNEVASGGADGMLSLWDTASARVLAALRSHSGTVYV